MIQPTVVTSSFGPDAPLLLPAEVSLPDAARLATRCANSSLMCERAASLPFSCRSRSRKSVASENGGNALLHKTGDGKSRLSETLHPRTAATLCCARHGIGRAGIRDCCIRERRQRSAAQNRGSEEQVIRDCCGVPNNRKAKFLWQMPILVIHTIPGAGTSGFVFVSCLIVLAKM